MENTSSFSATEEMIWGRRYTPYTDAPVLWAVLFIEFSQVFSDQSADI